MSRLFLTRTRSRAVVSPNPQPQLDHPYLPYLPLNAVLNQDMTNILAVVHWYRKVIVITDPHRNANQPSQHHITSPAAIRLGLSVRSLGRNLRESLSSRGWNREKGDDPYKFNSSVNHNMQCNLSLSLPIFRASPLSSHPMPLATGSNLSE